MAVNLNKQLQAFSDVIIHHGDNARVTLRDNLLQADTKDIGLFSRIFRPQASAQQIQENNDVRTALLDALAAQFGGLGEIPQSVLDALNGSSLRGKSDMSTSDGVHVSSGRPLTVRRIRVILNEARIAQAQKEQTLTQGDSQIKQLNDQPKKVEEQPKSEKKPVQKEQAESKGTGENSSGNVQKEMPQKVRTEKSPETGKSTKEESQALDKFRQLMDEELNVRVMSGIDQKDAGKDLVTKYAESYCRVIIDALADEEDGAAQEFWPSVGHADPDKEAEFDDITSQFARGLKENQDVIDKLSQAIRSHVCSGKTPWELKEVTTQVISDALKAFRAQSEKEMQALELFRGSMDPRGEARVQDGLNRTDGNKDFVTRYAESLCREMMTDSLDAENEGSQDFWLSIGRADPNGVHRTDDVTIEFVKGFEQNQKAFNRLSQAIRKHICDGGTADGLVNLAKRVVSEVLNEFRKEREPLPPNAETKPMTEVDPMLDALMKSEVLQWENEQEIGSAEESEESQDAQYETYEKMTKTLNEVFASLERPQKVRTEKSTETVMATEEERLALAKFQESMDEFDKKRVMDGVSGTDFNKDDVTRYAESLCHELRRVVVDENNKRFQAFWQRVTGADPNGTGQVDDVALKFKEEIGQDQAAFNRLSQAIRQYICDGGVANGLFDLTERFLLDMLKDFRQDEANMQELEAEVKQEEAEKENALNVINDPKILNLISGLSSEAVQDITSQATNDTSTRDAPAKWLHAYAQHSVKSLRNNAHFWNQDLAFLDPVTKQDLQNALRTSGWMLDQVEDSINGSVNSGLGHKGVQIQLKNFIVAFVQDFQKVQESVAGKIYTGANKAAWFDAPNGYYPNKVKNLQPGTVFRQGTNTCPIISLLNAMQMTSQETSEKAKSLITAHHSFQKTWFEFPFRYQAGKYQGKKVRASVDEFDKMFGKELEGKQVNLFDFEKAVFVALKKAGLRITKEGGDEALPGEQFEINPVFVLFGFKEPTSSGIKPGDRPTKFQQCQNGQEVANAINAGKPCVVRIPGHFMGIESVTFNKEGQPTYRCFNSSSGKYFDIPPNANGDLQFYIGEKP